MKVGRLQGVRASGTTCGPESVEYARLAEDEWTYNKGNFAKFHPKLTWEEEKTHFSSLGAMTGGFSDSVKYTKISDLGNADKVQTFLRTLLAKRVPGLSAVTFGEVFRIFAVHRCPLWLTGGVVRDLVADVAPNDVDCAALCHGTRIGRIIESAGWAPAEKPDDDGDDQFYFSIGKRVGNYLEGFAADLFFDDPFAGESSVGIMKLSPLYGWIIDPTGRGVADAVGRVLRPSVHPKSALGDDDLQKWWSRRGKDRFPRYIKMRLRDWQPVPKLRAFMGKYMVSSLVEVVEVWKELSSRCPVDDEEATACDKFAKVLVADAGRDIFDAWLSVEAEGELSA